MLPSCVQCQGIGQHHYDYNLVYQVRVPFCRVMILEHLHGLHIRYLACN